MYHIATLKPHRISNRLETKTVRIQTEQ